MPRVCAVSHERMTLVTDGYMCTSFLAFRPCRVKVTLGIFPMGCSVVPLTALEVIFEWARLSRHSPRAWTNEGPAAQMSALESGKASTWARPYSEVAWMLILGAGLNGTSPTFDILTCGEGTLRQLDFGILVGVCLGF